MSKKELSNTEMAINELGKASRTIKSAFYACHDLNEDMEDYPEYIAAQNSIASIAKGMAFGIGERVLDRLFYRTNI